MYEWGRGLFQTEQDVEIVADLSKELGYQLCAPFGPFPSSLSTLEPFDRVKTKDRLNYVDINKTLHTVRGLSQSDDMYKFRTTIIFGMLLMQAGATIPDTFLLHLRTLRRMLPTVEQQVQFIAALDGCDRIGIQDANVHWVSGSKTFAEIEATKIGTLATSLTDIDDLGDESGANFLQVYTQVHD
ncbi:hypothetical protein GGR57DRAFT_474387 [Xylariaceae sp. FL1272]|nr:hypothetical protein GGR57DRAFT_474387 [Xylariaceae sp. FL1272]